MDRLRLTHVDSVEGRKTAGQEHVAPVNAREVVNQLHITHLMVVGSHVAQLHLVVAGLGDARLDREHSLHFLLGRSLIVARHLEQVLQIGLVSLQHALVLLVVGEIVVAGAESESALTDAHDVPVGIALVGVHTDTKHHRRLTIVVELRRNKLIFAAVADGLNLIECRFDGCPSLAIEAGAVHHKVIQRANLLLQRTLLLRF